MSSFFMPFMYDELYAIILCHTHAYNTFKVSQASSKLKLEPILGKQNLQNYLMIQFAKQY